MFGTTGKMTEGKNKERRREERKRKDFLLNSSGCSRGKLKERT